MTVLEALITANGQEYVPGLFLVNTRNADGTPGLCTYVREDDEVSVEGELDFFVAYVPREKLEGGGT